MSKSSVSDFESQTALATKLDKCFYQADQQVKLLHLQAEIDCLLQQLQNLKLQRIASTVKEE
ncbi:hypothetical protein ACF3DV_24095 [Chlorogloeopsis fritschii PCC 9212]|jgi:hypothetical protein|uniref:Uncharacterized protein n=1 Tax=Chlorogloeopsis fritschii PCC 6912 TaxID=211165 RepID=A0A433NPV4_CHLFR|nr:hypothetical protein [Chlorogloeopsis fritschii]RUR85855.1 hypothetical protein PCC6912_06800 [Chlorogloeopsis fritschii PCC 6912]